MEHCCSAERQGWCTVQQTDRDGALFVQHTDRDQHNLFSRQRGMVHCLFNKDREGALFVQQQQGFMNTRLNKNIKQE